MGAEFDERSKKRGETDLQWRTRIAEMDHNIRDATGPLITAETEFQGDYRDEFVMHIETYTLARTKRNREQSPFGQLYDRGQITKEQYEAAVDIACAVERVQRSVSVRGASLEARVDCSGSASGLLVERLSVAKLEITYSLWRRRLPMPRQMIIDMIILPGSLFAKCRIYRMGWPKARKRLLDALDRWIELREKVAREVDEEDLRAAHLRLGEGAIA